MAAGSVISRPGALRRRANLEARTESPDGAGGTTPVWTVEASLWVDLKPVGAASVLPAEGRRQAISHRVVLRYRAGITLQKRFRIDGRVFAIRTIRDPDERRTWLECECEELS